MVAPFPVDAWERRPGSYLLILDLAADLTLPLRAVRERVLPTGMYAYAGSALGPGGVFARVRRHLQQDKRLHYHIDYLSAVAPIVAVVAAYGKERLECRWAQALAGRFGPGAAIEGFGNCDCQAGCTSHLVRLPHRLPLAELKVERSQCLTPVT